MTDTTHDTASRGLTRRQAVPLAIGSIAGSGILFLLSAARRGAGARPQRDGSSGFVRTGRRTPRGDVENPRSAPSPG
ncbi:hypothetical protein ACG5V6_18380 [Streptomyces chitinivorans]|uniref:Uncharacterized protein n=1 Tax=Streptomyces chitinivorans TaxID=1257027 RepID=A0ABW7HW93_9ACTN|nr:hypothetical protein [Streptomyces chitinivorans]MDH2408459.1 hypothetical protein [Streptomyces chitinivorans]